jgi:hypothetical protein
MHRRNLLPLSLGRIFIYQVGRGIWVLRNVGNHLSITRRHKPQDALTMTNYLTTNVENFRNVVSICIVHYTPEKKQF